jgi:hypothetical protein
MVSVTALHGPAVFLKNKNKTTPLPKKTPKNQRCLSDLQEVAVGFHNFIQKFVQARVAQTLLLCQQVALSRTEMKQQEKEGWQNRSMASGPGSAVTGLEDW